MTDAEDEKPSWEYWRYYDDEFDWDDSDTLCRPDLDHTRAVLASTGLSDSEATQLIRSGYVCFRKMDVIVDRYYGGALMSSDGRTRFSTRDLCLGDRRALSRVWLYRAKSMHDLRQKVEQHVSNSRKKILFRGQTANYTVEREVANPFFIVPEIGEISLVPSLWRRMLSAKRATYHNFQSLSLFEWSTIFYSAFDLDEMRRRERERFDAGEPILTLSDMEDCSDPVLREFGRYRADLNAYCHNRLAPVLATLLQHYGLYSPVLDLSSSLDVAIFFATHKFSRQGGKCTYHFIGTNNRKAVVYLLRDNRELHQPRSDEDTLRFLDPLRPKRQHCVVSGSSTFAINLPADFIEGVILLDFDLESDVSGLSTSELFPDSTEDKFLHALKSSPYAKRYLTDFGEK